METKRKTRILSTLLALLVLAALLPDPGRARAAAPDLKVESLGRTIAKATDLPLKGVIACVALGKAVATRLTSRLAEDHIVPAPPDRAVGAGTSRAAAPTRLP